MASSRRELRMVLGLTLILVALLLLLGTLLAFFSSQAYVANRNHSIQLEVEDVRRTTASITTYFQHYVKDLRLLIALPEVSEFIESEFDSTSLARSVEAHYANILGSRPEYYQIRILNSRGWEVVRVEQEEDRSITVVSVQDLQDKSGRYYFVDAMKKEPGEIYSSPLDLNQEGGVIEVPYVPVFRVASPVAGSHGEKSGMVILNVYAQELLRLLGSNMFLQTLEGNRFRLTDDGELYVEQTEMTFPDSAGSLQIGGDANVMMLYESVEPICGCWLGVVKEIDIRSMEKAFVMRAAIMVATYLASAFLVFLTTAIHYRRARKITSVQSAMVDSLTILATERDHESGLHLERVKQFSACLGFELAKYPEFRAVLTRSFIEDLTLAGALHDIGKVAIPDSVLLKEGPLNDQEWETMKQHSMIGARILQADIERHHLDDRFLTIARNICAYHHERMDGTGYPDGLGGDEIPLEARIFAVADAYDAIRSKRPYKRARSHPEAVQRIRDGAGSHFDPQVVRAFEACEREFARISLQLAD